MAEVILQNIMANWPPTTGAGLSDAPIAEPTDIIKHARVSREKYLVLTLSRGQESFTATERIVDGQAEAVRRIAHQLCQKTVEAAGRLVVSNTNTHTEKPTAIAASQNVR